MPAHLKLPGETLNIWLAQCLEHAGAASTVEKARGQYAVITRATGCNRTHKKNLPGTKAVTGEVVRALD